MKRLSYLLIVLFIVALAIPSLPYLGNTALAQDTLRVAKILDTQGDVKVFRAGGEKSFAAYKGMGLTQGDTIITDANGKVTLEVDKDKEMKIGPNTQLMISELVQSLRNNADKSSFNLKAGQVYTRVKNQLAPGAKYEIRTPTAVMGVRGTQFFVSLSNGVAEVVTLEGQVVVTVSQPVTGPDGTVTMQPIQIQVEPNQIFVQSPDAADPTQYDLATLTSNENLSLFVLETLQEINEQQPGLIDPQLLENLTEQIEQARQEQEQQEEQQQQQQTQDRGDSSGSGSGSSSRTPSIAIAELEDLTLACGLMINLPISVTPADASLSVSSVVYGENTAEVSLDGNTLYITAGETPGEITITITASKSGYLPATRSFTVTVSEPVGPQFLIAKTKMVFDQDYQPQYSIEITFDQPIEFVNEELDLTGKITVVEEDIGCFDEITLSADNNKLIVHLPNTDPYDADPFPSGFYSEDGLTIDADTVKSVANELPNEKIDNKPISDGIGPRLLNVNYGIVEDEDEDKYNLILRFQEEIFFVNDAAPLSGASIWYLPYDNDEEAKLDLDNGTHPEIIDDNRTLKFTIPVDNFPIMQLRRIEGVFVKDSFGNTNDLIMLYLPAV